MPFFLLRESAMMKLVNGLILYKAGNKNKEKNNHKKLKHKILRFSDITLI